MKTMANSVAMRRSVIFPLASLLAWSLLLAGASLAQTPPAGAPQPGTSPQRSEEDPLGRSTPYGAVMGFVRAAQHNEYDRAVQYLDTRKRGEAAEELARQLETVLDRGLMADLDRLSRKPEGDLQDGLRVTRERVGTIQTSSGPLDVVLDRIERGGQKPIWMFSSDTLALIPDAAAGLNLVDYEKDIPRFLVETRFLSLALYRWILMTILLAIALSLASLVTRGIVPLLRPPFRHITGEEDDRALSSIRAPMRLLLVALAIRLFSTVSVSLLMRQFWTRVATVVAIVGFTWLLIQFSNIVSGVGTTRLRRHRMPGKLALLALLNRLFKAAVVGAAVLVLLYRAGVDLTAILAGLGVGGLAIAFAAQKTLENLFGGMMIISDEPIRVGDFCQIADQMGTVEDIGLRSTRIRTLARTVIAIPNGQLAGMNIENFSLRDKFWFRHLIGLRYETSPDQLRCVLAEVRTMLYSHPRVESDGARIRFVGFGGSSLDLEIFAYVKATEMPEFLGIQEDILLRIMDIIADAGTAVAFPSQTTYLARDTPLDAQKAEQSVARVREWRERRELPFPDFHPDQVSHFYNRIEYPAPDSALRKQ